ncbi:hypoxia-inducible factor 1-alpha [Parasteatoda tepidariorum]|uniref:hypoxia-inducible factor 1-alpha n=1 Tax=Parasteatoda tepidariorum TaxID=114398 RepID=UPI00077FCB83|nr:hypoxia-inducible factor 1-alpha [Parasteatoda tepidariorum]XP_015915902.1 hypoxia-inducible factor 1-alpha [Parasteatoda tepidariorum]XP_015915903.1 hypoxia-inducible factor 1-alpha [Parasteatoda tepidariorum]XP_015915904.1 hypoxia-inducible factor 1-alpha [Parasteatoda tepidariorum]
METKKILEKRKNDEKIPGKNHYTNNAAVRIQRNQAEKQRRDRLNDQIAQLATLVPPAVNASKPLDKVSILRLSASWMRLNYSCLNAKRFKSAVVNYLDMHHSLVTNMDILEKSINGFIIATTFTGVVLMCSRYSEEFIGYQNIDLLGHHISNFVLPKEKDLLMKKMRNLISKYKNGSSNPRNVVRVRMQQRPLPRSNEMRYRKMSFSLSIHSGDEMPQSSAPLKKSLKIGRHKDFGESAIILIFAEPVQLEPDIDVQYLEQRDCYFTIHGTQGEIIFADHRISIMTGYMPRDVLGNSAYQYIHCSDVPIALFAQKAMFASSDGTGIITYRLRIRNSSYIYLQTKGQIRYKDSTKEVRQFICCNILLSDEDGNRELKKFQDRYAPQLKESKITLQEIKSPTKSIITANVDSGATRNTPVEHENIKQKSCPQVTNGSFSDVPMDMEEPNTTDNTKNSSVYLDLSKVNYNEERNHSLSSSSEICSLSSADNSLMANTFSCDSQAFQIMNYNKAVSPEALSCNVQRNNTLSSFDLMSPVQSMSSSTDAYAEPVIQENDDFPVIVNSNFLTSDLLLTPDDYTCYDTEKPFFQSQKCTSSEVNCTQNQLQENVGSFNVSDNIEMVADDFLIPQDVLQNYATINSESLNIPDGTFARFENGHGNVNSYVSQNHFSTFNPKITFAGDSQSALNMRMVNAAIKSIPDNNSQANIDLSFLDNTVENMALLSDLSDFYENAMPFTKANHNNQFQTETASSVSGTEMNCDIVLNDTNCTGGLGLVTQTSSDIHISNNAHSPEKFNNCSRESYFTSDNDNSVGANGMRTFNADYFQTHDWQMKEDKIPSTSTKQKINDHIYSQFQTNVAIRNDGRVYKVSRKGLNHLHPSMNSQSTLNHAQNEYVADLDNQSRSSLCPTFQESMFENIK